MSTDTPDTAAASAASPPIYNRIVFVLSLLGVLVAGALWYWHAHPVDIPCGSSGGCETVAQSTYSSFPPGSGIPVAMYGTLGYIALATLAFLRTLPGTTKRDRTLLLLTVLGGSFGTLASLWLTYLELFVIHAICRWCMMSQTIILGIALVSITELAYHARRGISLTSSQHSLSTTEETAR